MKPWQKGIEIEDLELYASWFKNHNKHCLSPFTEVNKPKVADAMSTGRWFQIGTKLDGPVVVFIAKQLKRESLVKFHDTIVVKKMPGDIVIDYISLCKTAFGLPSRGEVFDELGQRFGSTWVAGFQGVLWLHVNMENLETVKWVQDELRLTHVSTKFASTGEVIGVFARSFNEHNEPLFKRLTQIPDYQFATIKTVSNFYMTEKEVAETVLKPLGKLTFANHYSNYNKGKSWSALALRGYSDDPTFIEKPSEVMQSKKWRSKYERKEWRLQNTSIYHSFPIVQNLLKALPGEPERIRFMKLAPGGGELQRHTDQADVEAGTAPGQLMRFHYPIVTNPAVQFFMWNHTGIKETHFMGVGYWHYLDVRKPHMAINGGDEDRIHLVVDLWANDDLRRLINERN